MKSQFSSSVPRKVTIIAELIPDGAGYPLHLTAGPIDALAISTWRGRRAWAAGGAAALGAPALARVVAATGREVVMEPPRGRAGGVAGADLVGRLQRRGVRARITWLPEGTGPTDVLAAGWADLTAVLQYQNGMDRLGAEAAAWEGVRFPQWRSALLGVDSGRGRNSTLS